jgi:hypothetical protein
VARFLSTIQYLTGHRCISQNAVASKIQLSFISDPTPYRTVELGTSSESTGVAGNFPGIDRSLMVVTLLEVFTCSRPGRVEYSVGVVVPVDIVRASVEAVGAEVIVGASVDSVNPLDRTEAPVATTGIGGEEVP